MINITLIRIMCMHVNLLQFQRFVLVKLKEILNKAPSLQI
jgi:hypothetical protein